MSWIDPPYRRNTNIYKKETSILDRFIPKRENFDWSYYQIKKGDAQTDLKSVLSNLREDISFLNISKLVLNNENYQKQLWSTMFPTTDKILTFSSPPRTANKRQYTNVPEINIWPVHPRKKPLLSPPKMILDLPELNTYPGSHVISWGRSGHIATIYESEVHLWHPESNLITSVTKTSRSVDKCVKWNHEGTQISMTTTSPAVLIWDLEKAKVTQTVSCTCLYVTCNVTALEWTKSRIFLTGCSNGMVQMFSSKFKLLGSSKAHNFDVLCIKSSCLGNNFVTSGIDRKVIIWHKFQQYITIKCIVPVKTLDWHPWCDSLLVYAGNHTLNMYNVNSFKTLSKRSHHPSAIVDSITFNPLSAELVVSYYDINPDTKEEINYITVQKNFRQILDEVVYHKGRIPYLLWDNTGSLLASASTEESLCIWDFFGTEYEENKTHKKLSKYRTKHDICTKIYSCIR